MALLCDDVPLRLGANLDFIAIIFFSRSSDSSAIAVSDMIFMKYNKQKCE